MDLILETLSLALPDYAFMDWESCASVFGCMPRGRYFQVMAHKDAGGGVFLKKVISTLTELYGEEVWFLIYLADTRMRPE